MATSRGALAVVIALALVAIAGGRARAQSAEAEALFNDADKLMAAGKVGEACDAFEASNRIEPRAGTLIRLGDCRAQNHQLASAWSAYKDALTRVKDPKKKDIATQALAAIEPRLSYLTVSVPDESRVDGLELARNGRPLDPGLWNRAIPVDGGDYVIGGRAPGHEEWTTKVTVPVEGGKVTVDVPKFKELTKLVTPPDGEHAVPDPAGGAAVHAGGETPGPLTTQREIALGVAGAGVLALGLGIVEGMGSSSDRDAAFQLCPDPATPCPKADEAQADLDRGKSKALIANIGYGVGVAALIGAAALWFTGAPEVGNSRVTVTPALTQSATGVDVTIRF